MPIKFLCEHCGGKLQVATRKAGTEQKCPRCDKLVIVPDAEIAAMMMAMKSNDRFSGGADVEDDEFLEFAIHDDEELVYDSETRDVLESAPTGKIDPDRISLPRLAVFIQGALLGVVACVFFVFGLMVGRVTTSPETQANARQLRCQVVGEVQYRSNNQARPDNQSVVILLPQRRRLDVRPNSQALRPGMELDANDPNQQLIREIGGEVTVVDSKGDFELTVPSPAEYYLLIISMNRRRPSDKSITKEQRAAMGAYFVPVDELISDHDFTWQELSLTGSSRSLGTIEF